MSELTLSDLKVSESGVIESLEGESDLRQRLMELGLVKGTKVTVKRFAPLGDPMEILVRGYNLSLRKEDAALVRVSKLS